ncbi:MAG: 50S ribosomal protein L29 [Alphaproteobacteria bacterium]|nr:50S ribosomal protein L29 [Alphaproteobacteria bacterium]
MAEKKTSKRTKAAGKPAADSKPKSRAKKADLAKAKVASAADDFRAKSSDELSADLNRLKKEQFNLRFQRANGQLEKTSRVRVVRRDIARIQTIMSEQRRRALQQRQD